MLQAILLDECSGLWGEPERVAGCISVSQKKPGGKVRASNVHAAVFVEECSMGMCSSWVHCTYCVGCL